MNKVASFTKRCFFIVLTLATCHTVLAEKPAAPKDEWKGTNFNTAHSASVSSVRPFDPSIHEKMTPTGAVCTEQLNAAIYRQDVLHAFESRAHYDNCAFELANDYILSLLAKSEHAFSQRPDQLADAERVPQNILDGMLFLGQILHAIQDFYAHSSYVEFIQQQEVIPELEQNIPVILLWTDQGQRQLIKYADQGLRSGKVWWTFPQHCKGDTPTHSDLAKDSPSTPAGSKESVWKRAVGTRFQNNYNIAYNLAHRSTRGFLQWSGKHWPIIEKYCGKTLKYIITRDLRQADLVEKEP